MKRKLWMCVVMVLLVPGLLLTVSCAKKTAADSDAAMTAEPPKVEDPDAQRRAMEEARLAEEQRAREAARSEFVNTHVFFDFDSAVLTPMAQNTLRQKAAFLQENAVLQVTIEGHCDERGTNEYNLALGERRAQSVKAFLVDLGIASDRMDTISYGEERPLDPGHNESAWARNRRAQFVIN